MSRVVKQDARSTTYRKLALIRKETGVNTFVVPIRKVREAVPLRKIPVNQFWRPRLLQNLLNAEAEERNGEPDGGCACVDGMCAHPNVLLRYALRRGCGCLNGSCSSQQPAEPETMYTGAAGSTFDCVVRFW